MRKYIWLLAFFAVFASCSTEETTVKDLTVTQVSNTPCKGSWDVKMTRSADDSDDKTTIGFGALTKQTVKCTLENVAGNCDLDKIYVGGALQDGTIVIYVYKTKETMADCYCDYDVSFDLNNVEAGRYPIEVHRAESLQKVNANNLVYAGSITLSKNTTTQRIDIPKITLYNE